MTPKTMPVTFNTTVTERDPGVKVVDFQIKVAPEKARAIEELVPELERLVIDLKARAAASETETAGMRDVPMMAPAPVASSATSFR
ncbi:MAG: hypothetical protein WDN28_03865 [Chthoniobacter sp.]